MSNWPYVDEEWDKVFKIVINTLYFNLSKENMKLQNRKKKSKLPKGGSISKAKTGQIDWDYPILQLLGIKMRGSLP